MVKQEGTLIQNRHTSLGLTDERVLEMYRYMLLTRKVDERLWLLNRAGKIPFVVSGQGQEAAQIGMTFAMEHGKDYIAPYYRDLGVVLAYGMTTKEVMLSNFAKAEDPNSGGRQMPGHYGQKKNNMLTGSSPVTTQVPHAVGFALAAKMEKKDFVTLVTLGEGSTNQGDFHEGLNFAGVHQLPVITVVQNNKYAISVPFDKQVASEDVAIRAKSYGMPGIKVDGNDPLAVYEAVKNAHTRAKNGEGPTLIEAVTERLTAHSSDDNDRLYRDEEELQAIKAGDCLPRFKQYLQDAQVLTDAIENRLLKEISALVDEATDYAENAPFAALDTLGNYVYEQ